MAVVNACHTGDWDMGTDVERNNQGGLGWRRNGTHIYVPLSRVTGYVVYSIPQSQ